MTRPLIPLALLALAVLPDWATAFGRRGASCPPPAVTYCPPPVVLVPPCLPPFEVAPQQQPAPARPGPTVTQEPGPSEPPRPEPTPAEPPKVTPAPPPRPVAPGIPPGTGRSDASPPKPAAPVEPAGLTVPKPAQPSPFTEITPKVEVPKVAAPAPKEPDAAKIPPLAPPLPGGDAGLPPLSIPPTPAGTSTSKASPLTGTGHRVEVIPVDGPPPASPSDRRTVGFFNHTDRPVTLVVEGQTLTLPARHHVSAEVPAAFAWTLDGGPERKTEVPTAAPGVEVVIRK